MTAPEPIAYCAVCGKGLHAGDLLCNHTGLDVARYERDGCACGGEHVGEVTIPMTGVELTEAERAQVVEAYDHEADAQCWQDHCEDGLWHAVAHIVAARLAPVEAARDRNHAWWTEETNRSHRAEAEIADLKAQQPFRVAEANRLRAEAAEAEVVRLRAALSGEEHAPGPSDNKHGHNGSCVKCLRAKVATLGGTS